MIGFVREVVRRIKHVIAKSTIDGFIVFMTLLVIAIFLVIGLIFLIDALIKVTPVFGGILLTLLILTPSIIILARTKVD